MLKKPGRKTRRHQGMGFNEPRFTEITVKPVKNKSNQYTDDILKDGLCSYVIHPMLVDNHFWKDPPADWTAVGASQ